MVEDPTYRNACRNSDPENARIELDETLKNMLIKIMNDYNQFQLYQQYSEKAYFKRWLTETMFNLTYQSE